MDMLIAFAVVFGVTLLACLMLYVMGSFESLFAKVTELPVALAKRASELLKPIGHFERSSVVLEVVRGSVPTDGDDVRSTSCNGVHCCTCCADHDGVAVLVRHSCVLTYRDC